MARFKPRTDKKRQESSKPSEEHSQPQTRQIPRYHVVLWNDNDHTVDYVIGMMRKLFGHPTVKGREIANEVDSRGKAICITSTLEYAEFKRDQILSFGSDPVCETARGSMRASVEPAA